MIYLYYDKVGKMLYSFEKMKHMNDIANAVHAWKNIETVTADKERGQVVAHVLDKGLVAEFPLGHTVLTCQLPV